MHGYDLRRRSYLGEVDEVTVELRPGRAYFLALLPGSVPDLKLVVPGRARRGETVKVRIALPGSTGSHAVKLRAYLPEGVEADWFREILLVGSEFKEVVLPIAFNDPVGRWRVEARELFSGKRALKEVEVR